ncbi:MAG TPA: hypothetical protein VGK06_12530 [Methanosarcina sp.]|jgi:hypothetical protein
MWQSDEPLVRADTLFQPLKEILFGFIFYLFQDIFFLENDGWLVIWVILIVIGIISTFAPALGSIEEFIYKVNTRQKWNWRHDRSSDSIIPVFSYYILLGQLFRISMA